MIGPLKRLLVVLVLGVVLAGSVALAQRQALEPQTYMVPMRDGVRVAVSSSNYPRFSANPNTGVDTDEGGETRVAANTVYVGGTDGSRVILPVVMGEGREPEAP